jgi:hypothetical protein
MPFVPLDVHLPRTAAEETRSLTLLRGSGDVPAGTYFFVELYCDEPGCDCRRVMLYVQREGRGGPEAVITFGWEPRSFYRNWLPGAEEEDLDVLQGPALNPGSPAGPHARQILDLARETLFGDEDYLARLQRHYERFRAAVGGPSARARSWPAPRQASSGRADQRRRGKRKAKAQRRARKANRKRGR